MLFPNNLIFIKIKLSCFSPSNAIANSLKRTKTKYLKKNNVVKSIVFKGNYSNGERAYLSTSKASITIEATCAMFVFMIVVCSIIGFTSVVNAQLSVEKGVNNVSLEAAKARYFVDYEKYLKDDYKKYAEKGYLAGRVWSNITSQNDDMFGIINPVDSKVINDHIDVSVTYQIKIPFTNYKWWVTQRGKTKDWTGVDITEKKDVVYITKYGEVYHRSKQCSHLSITIQETTAGCGKSGNNVYGKKYKRCQYCARRNIADNTTVFITPDGDSMHLDLGCGGLTRSIIEIDIKEVGSKKPCSECGG